MSLQSLFQRAPRWAQALLFNGYAWQIERHRYGPAYRAMLARLREQERWDPEALRRLQDERLRRVVRAAYQGSPYYRRAMDESGVDPRGFAGVQDLPRLPLLTKDTVRDRARELWTRKGPGRGDLHGHTSGTTGSPLSLWYDRDTCVINNAVDRRQKEWGGMREGDWLGLLLGRVVVAPERARPPFWQVNHVQKQVWFSSFHLSPAHLPAYLDEMRRRKLRFLEGYPSTLFILAQHLVRRGETLPMRAVFTSSETLHQAQRDAIETAFGCRIFDFYGLAERVIFAGECEAHAGKHLSEEYGVTEVVDEGGNPVPDGETGYLVGTSLVNRFMPMLRYRTGDLSAIVAEPCACGRTLRRIRDVTTKAEDIVVTPDGRMISPSILTHPFKPFHQLRKSQLVQERLDLLRVLLVPSEEFTAAHEALLVEGLRGRLGEEMRIEVEVVEDIPREASGKFRWVISRVPHECRFAWAPAAE